MNVVCDFCGSVFVDLREYKIHKMKHKEQEVYKYEQENKDS